MFSNPARSDNKDLRGGGDQELYEVQLKEGGGLLDEQTFVADCERDRIEAQSAMKREQHFHASWHRFSTNRIWAEDAKPVQLFDESVQDYKELQAVWPNGRNNLQALSLYGQVWDFFLLHVAPHPTLQDGGPARCSSA